ncbi:MAG: galactokinase [Peptoniphilaceae bacterium]|nr:galactokinase [Peptoniphilaceae bacterium]MDY5766055.1 galactokinase [Peptoniphilaceae bacterium]
MESKIREVLDQAWADRFGDSADSRYFFAPSRINIIGEHIDYNGGNVFPCAITIGTYARAKKNNSGTLRLYSKNLDRGGELPLPLPEYQAGNGWMNYPAGVFHYLEDLGYRIGGMDVVVYGDIPNGSGLSSSSSLELLFGQIVNSFYNDGQIPIIDLVHAGVSCENDFFGLHTGIMDQYVIGFGKKNHAMVLDTKKEEHFYVPFTLPGAKIVIMNTNRHRALKDSKYNERREECEKALRELQQYKKADFLCEYAENDLPLLDSLSSDVLRRRARHVITEQARVKRAVKALQNEDLALLGRLLRKSQDSLREDYEVTGPYLDAICDAANMTPGCFGARMTGAGFAGCAIALVQEEAIPEFTQDVGKQYHEKTGLEAQFILSIAGDGARELRFSGDSQ